MSFFLFCIVLFGGNAIEGKHIAVLWDIWYQKGGANGDGNGNECMTNQNQRRKVVPVAVWCGSFNAKHFGQHGPTNNADHKAKIGNTGQIGVRGCLHVFWAYLADNGRTGNIIQRIDDGCKDIITNQKEHTIGNTHDKIPAFDNHVIKETGKSRQEGGKHEDGSESPFAKNKLIQEHGSERSGSAHNSGDGDVKVKFKVGSTGQTYGISSEKIAQHTGKTDSAGLNQYLIQGNTSNDWMRKAQETTNNDDNNDTSRTHKAQPFHGQRRNGGNRGCRYTRDDDDGDDSPVLLDASRVQLQIRCISYWNFRQPVEDYRQNWCDTHTEGNDIADAEILQICQRTHERQCHNKADTLRAIGQRNNVRACLWVFAHKFGIFSLDEDVQCGNLEVNTSDE